MRTSADVRSTESGVISAAVESLLFAREMPRSTCAGEPTRPISSFTDPPTFDTSALSPIRRAAFGCPVTTAAASSSRILESYDDQTFSSSSTDSGRVSPASSRSAATAGSPPCVRT